MAANTTYNAIMREIDVKSVLRALTLISTICAVPEFAHAAVSPCAVCTLPAPIPEIGDGVVGFAVAAVILFTVLMLPRIKRLLQTSD